jgi:hypothetical protein
MLRRGGGQLLVMDGPGDTAGICPIRPLIEVLGAALDLDRIGRLTPPPSKRAPSIDDLAETLELYRWGDGYAEYPGTDALSSVDNALVVMAALQAHDQLDPPVADSLWLHTAKRTFDVVGPGVVREELAGRLFLVSGIERFATIAEQHGDSPTTLIDGLDTGEPTTGERLWQRAPAENAARFRDLLTTAHPAEARPGVLAELDRYLARVWREGRDPSTGRFTAGGIGRSGDGVTLDHAALVRLFTWQAMPPGPATSRA